MKGKRLVLLVLVLLLAAMPVLGEENEAEEETVSQEEAYASAYRHAIAENVYVCDMNDLAHVYMEKAAHEDVAMASTTKIMTCMLALEHCELDEIVKVDREAASLGGTNSLMGLVSGEEITVEELLYGLMLPSGNDAALALAIHIGGSVEEFVVLMNQRAQELGLYETAFTNPSGVAREGHYSTAYDMAKLTRFAMGNETFRTIVSTAKHTVPANSRRKVKLELTNRNRLISSNPKSSTYYEYAIGVKTGTTWKGSNLIAAAQKEDVVLICVQLGAVKGEDDAYRARRLAENAKEIFEYVFNYEYGYAEASELISQPIAYEVPVENYRITDENEGWLTLQADISGAKAFRPLYEIEALRQGGAVFEANFIVEEAQAPIAAGQKLGTVELSYKDRVWFTCPLIASRSVEVFTEADLSTPTPAPTDTPAPTEEPADTIEDTPAPAATPTAASPIQAAVVHDPLLLVLAGLGALLGILLLVCGGLLLKGKGKGGASKEK